MSRVIGFLTAALLASVVSSPAPASANQVVQSERATDLFTRQLLGQVSVHNAVMAETMLQGLTWKVGDSASYKLNMMIFSGKVETQVREDTGEGFWVQQDMDLGFLGKQKAEILYNKSTGEVIKFLVNGQEQQIPSASDIEVVEMKESHITVPAGAYDAIYVKVKDKKNNQEQEAWLNPKEIPISGILKSIGNSQLGKITQELTTFRKQ
jgi:hypothetical protein